MNYRAKLLILISIVTSVIISGCGGGGKSSYTTFKGSDGSGTAEWTVMAFINADNDLERYSIDNVNQMEQIGSTADVKVVCQWDRSPGYSTADGDWETTRRYELTKAPQAGTQSKLIQDMGEVDMGDPQVMKDFITWAQTNYPARHYCLVIWNHGRGWRAINPISGSDSRNVSFDDTSNTSISTRDLPDILRSAATPIDLVAMDASLMQMAEVAYEMQGCAKYLVGSEDSPPGEGYVYDKWIGPLAANPAMNAQALGKIIVDTYVQAYVNDFPVTQSVVDLSRVREIAPAIDGLAAALIPLASTNAAALKTVRQNSQKYSYDDYNYRDLVDYAKRANAAVGNAALSSAYANLLSTMGQVVVYEGHTGTADANSHGLSIWIPDPASYSLWSTKYSAMSLSQDTRWDEYLAAQQQ